MINFKTLIAGLVFTLIAGSASAYIAKDANLTGTGYDTVYNESSSTYDDKKKDKKDKDDKKDGYRY